MSDIEKLLKECDQIEQDLDCYIDDLKKVTYQIETLKENIKLLDPEYKKQKAIDEEKLKKISEYGNKIRFTRFKPL